MVGGPWILVILKLFWGHYIFLGKDIIFTFSSGRPPPSEKEAGWRGPQAEHPLRQAAEPGVEPRHPAGAAHHPAAHLAVRLPLLHAGQAYCNTRPCNVYISISSSAQVISGLIAGGSFSEMSDFMPGVKVLLQLAQQQVSLDFDWKNYLLFASFPFTGCLCGISEMRILKPVTGKVFEIIYLCIFNAFFICVIQKNLFKLI